MSAAATTSSAQPVPFAEPNRDNSSQQQQQQAQQAQSTQQQPQTQTQDANGTPNAATLLQVAGMDLSKLTDVNGRVTLPTSLLLQMRDGGLILTPSAPERPKRTSKKRKEPPVQEERRDPPQQTQPPEQQQQQQQQPQTAQPPQPQTSQAPPPPGPAAYIPQMYPYPPPGIDFSVMQLQQGMQPPPHMIPPPGQPPQPPQSAQHQQDMDAQSRPQRQLSTSKRAEQNRKAQRAFRERREQHVRALESRSQLLEAALSSADEANRRWEECRALVDQLRIENTALRSALQQAQTALASGGASINTIPSATNGSTSAPNSEDSKSKVEGDGKETPKDANS